MKPIRGRGLKPFSVGWRGHSHSLTPKKVPDPFPGIQRTGRSVSDPFPGIQRTGRRVPDPFPGSQRMEPPRPLAAFALSRYVGHCGVQGSLLVVHQVIVQIIEGIVAVVVVVALGA